MNSPRRVIGQVWAFLLLPLGAALAFLSLEVIGIPLVVLALGLIAWAGRRTGNTARGLMFFGVGFVACVSFFGLLSLVLTPDGGGSRTLWFAIHFAVGLAMIAAGLAFHVLSDAGSGHERAHPAMRQ